MSNAHLKEIAECPPRKSLEELIWNALDAGGHVVRVRFLKNELGGLSEIQVEDEGVGIPFQDLARAFGTLNKSLKVMNTKTHEGRNVHGRKGQGRLKALWLGNSVKWITTYAEKGRFLRYEIDASRTNLKNYKPSQPSPADATRTGTVAIIRDPVEDAEELLDKETIDYLNEHFALYLSDYPNVLVEYDDSKINPSAKIVDAKEYELRSVSGYAEPPILKVVSWDFQTSGKLHFCDEEGFSLYDLDLRVLKRGLEFTAYLRHQVFREWADKGNLHEANEEVRDLQKKAREKVKGYIRERLADQSQELVEKWKEEKSYPYSEDEKQTGVHIREKQVFNILASTIHAHHEPFRKAKAVQERRFTLQLVRQALESNPGSLKRVLQEVLKLPQDQIDDFAELLDSTNLGAIIKASRVVQERLQSIAEFRHILFNKNWRKTLLERTQLHRLLIRHLWIFGESYELDTDDAPIRDILETYIERHFKRKSLAPVADPKTIKRQKQIPDIMLSRCFKRPHGEWEYLVIELKRPKTTLGSDEFGQIENYAAEISLDDRIQKNHNWSFVLLGNRVDQYGEMRLDSARRKGFPPGCITETSKLKVFIWPWKDVLKDAEARYRFFSDKLDMEAQSIESLPHFRKHHQELIEGRGLTKKQEAKFLAQKKSETT